MAGMIWSRLRPIDFCAFYTIVEKSLSHSTLVFKQEDCTTWWMALWYLVICLDCRYLRGSDCALTIDTLQRAYFSDLWLSVPIISRYFRVSFHSGNSKLYGSYTTTTTFSLFFCFFFVLHFPLLLFLFFFFF